MLLSTRRFVSLALTAIALTSPRLASAQVRTFQACSQGPLKNCANIRLTSQLGVGPASTNLFEIGIQNLGSQTTPTLATSIYFAAFLTGLSEAANAVDTLITPKAIGGATLTDANKWSLFESGDAMFLSAPLSNGIGGCALSAPVNSYGQIGQTCGTGSFETFSFYTTRAINVNSVTLSDMEFVAIAPGNAGDSCNADAPCVISSGVTVTPEPATVLLLLAGLATVGVATTRRRTNASSRTMFVTEA